MRFLLRLRDTGMSIAKMRVYSELRAAGDQTLESRMTLLRQHDAEVRQQIEQLRANRRALRDKIAVYQSQIDARERSSGTAGK
ncbi:MerR family DNA-binding protein [Kribbella sp. HUAS MG21]|uniref:MerR family DNA-binding protein n=1 Tax=Kribbella sp. HUAS MG21 TaxID=3160966 RepID=A0AAU7TGZ3_9ACTN